MYDFRNIKPPLSPPPPSFSAPLSLHPSLSVCLCICLIVADCVNTLYLSVSVTLKRSIYSTVYYFMFAILSNFVWRNKEFGLAIGVVLLRNTNSMPLPGINTHQAQVEESKNQGCQNLGPRVG